MDELALRGVFGQVAQEGTRLRNRPSLDRAGVRREEQRLAPGVRMDADEALADRPEAGDLLRGQVGEADGRARMDQGVLADQILDLVLGPWSSAS